MNDMEIRDQHDIEKLTPEQLGGEIRLLTLQARRMALSYGIQIGYRLHIAHEKVGPHGWAEWLKKETDFSAAAASRFESLYEGYGEDQGNLFGVGNKFPTLENLSISNALQLLAFPEDEREKVAAELDAGHLSSRELSEAIAARKAAEERALKAERALHEAEEGQGLAIAELQEKLDAAIEDGRRGQEAIHRQEQLQKDLDDAGRRLKEAKDQIKELEERPIATVKERDEQAIEEAVRAARAKAEADASEKINAIQKKLEKAERERDKLKDAAQKAESGVADKIAAAEHEAAAAKEALEDVRRQLAASNKDVTEFILHSKAVQQSFSAMFDSLDKIAERDMQTAQKLNAGTLALLKRFADRCSGLEGRGSSAEPLPNQINMGGVILEKTGER